jgi:hypothetical protein
MPGCFTWGACQQARSTKQGKEAASHKITLSAFTARAECSKGPRLLRQAGEVARRVLPVVEAVHRPRGRVRRRGAHLRLVVREVREPRGEVVALTLVVPVAALARGLANRDTGAAVVAGTLHARCPMSVHNSLLAACSSSAHGACSMLAVSRVASSCPCPANHGHMGRMQCISSKHTWA